MPKRGIDISKELHELHRGKREGRAGGGHRVGVDLADPRHGHSHTERKLLLLYTGCDAMPC